MGNIFKLQKRHIFLILFTILFTGCLSIQVNSSDNSIVSNIKIIVKTFNYYDSVRSRNIPIAIYEPESVNNNKKLVILSHGYGKNKSDSYLWYSYIAENLASNGYFVVSIQHELSTDSLLPKSGIPQIVRMPFWDRGADNIYFVINKLKNIHTELDFSHITLIGHSNGGDMSVFFQQKYPNIVEKIITLDNRRMALPRINYPKIYSLRSSDQTADENVLPTEDEQNKFGIRIIKLPNTIHNDMNDNANETQRKEINGYLMMFINE
jgi:predicted peptidase